MEKEIHCRDLEPKKKTVKKKDPNLFQISKTLSHLSSYSASQELHEVGKIYLSVLQVGKKQEKLREA